jgi:osmoprotectant transport system permease protein
LTDLISFWIAHRAELLTMLGQHVLLVALSTTVAIAMGVPAGILAVRRPSVGKPLLAIGNIAQTIPSLALFGFLIPIPFIGGIGPTAAIVALILYALLPIMRSTAAGLQGIDAAILEAGTAMGMTSRQRLRLVELPLALPSIVSGIRVATVIGVGTATIAAAIGAGGLGEYIFRGLSMVDGTVILAGAIPAAVLALSADAFLGFVERRLSRGRRSFAALPAVAGVLLALVLATAILGSTSADRIVVGSKNFTEQVILGELLAQAVERESAVTVTRKLNLGGTFICDRAVRSGDIDMYVEYTGTALTAIFHEKTGGRDRRAVLNLLRDRYSRLGVTVGAPLGFNNTFAILVRGKDARQLGLRTIGDLRRVQERWQPGFGFEFLEREDGYKGLVRAYDLRFPKAPVGMDLMLIYRALAKGQVDVIAGDATSPQIAQLDLAMLQDDRSYFPPYDAVPIINTSSLLKRPALGRALGRLAGKISEAQMRAMNLAVDVRREDARVVAREFLARLEPAGGADQPVGRGPH